MMLQNQPMYAIDACMGISPEDFELISDQHSIFVMPIRLDAQHYYLKDLAASCLVVGVGLMPDNWQAVPAPHYIPIAGVLAHAVEPRIDDTKSEVFFLLNNLCVLMTMMGKDVYYPRPGKKNGEFISTSYSPLYLPDSFAVVDVARHKIKDHINQKFLSDDMAFFRTLQAEDEKVYKEVQERIRRMRGG